MNDNEIKRAVRAYITEGVQADASDCLHEAYELTKENNDD